jgi:hypothetical protein
LITKEGESFRRFLLQVGLTFLGREGWSGQQSYHHHSLMVVVCRAVGTIVAVDSLASELCSISDNNKTKSNSRITMIGIGFEFPLCELDVLLSDNLLVNLPVVSQLQD